jgi:hypothetical protein
MACHVSTSSPMSGLYLRIGWISAMIPSIDSSTWLNTSKGFRLFAVASWSRLRMATSLCSTGPCGWCFAVIVTLPVVQAHGHDPDDCGS